MTGALLPRWAVPVFLLLVFTSCSDETGPPGGDPPATLTVEYLAGGEAALPSNTLTVTRAPVELAPGNTTWCAEIHVQGATPAGPPDPDRPQVSNPSVAMCADQLESFPVPFDEVIDGTVENRGISFATANSIRYQADSGSVQMQPLVGGYAQVDMDAWYRTPGVGSPFTFRIRGRLIAHE
jgi:hypothetical protein